MAVPVAVGQGLEVGEPQVLFEAKDWVAPSPWPSYDVTPDGRFVLMLDEAGESGSSNEIVVVLNWQRELLKRMSGENE